MSRSHPSRERLSGCGWSSAPNAPALESLEARELLSGVTLITHGFQADGNRPAYLDGWAAAVADRLGARGIASTRYELKIFENGSATFNKLVASDLDPDLTTRGEIILTVDWAERSNDFVGNTFSGSQGDDIALEILPWLLNAVPSAGVDVPLAQLPIHVLGHSRGASVISELSRFLGEQGVWVDQVTFLDPHPLTTSDASVSSEEVDPQPRVFENVIFADDYWRQDGFNFFEPFDFDGQPVAGSFMFELNESVLDGSDDAYGLEHSDVHLFYYGTIDLSPSANEDGSETVPNSWYGAHGVSRSAIGFHYSRIGGGDLTSTADPGGSRTNRVVDGYSSILGGAGSRVALNRAAADWPSLITLESTGGSVIEIGADVPVDFIYQDVDSEAAVLFFLDNDTNPYNAGSSARPLGSKSLPQTTAQFVFVDQASLSTVNLDPGTYFLFAAIGDAEGHVRYRYLDQSVTLVDTTPPALTELLVRGSAWPTVLLDHLQANGLGNGGFDLHIGSASPTVPLVAWLGLNQIIVRFNEDVTVAAQSLSLHGVTVPLLTASSVSYDPATFTATWTFASPLTLDKWDVVLTGAIADAAGNPLGSDFHFRINVVPGDADKSGNVSSVDVIRVRNAQFTQAGQAGYDPGLDVNGNGSVQSNDVIFTRNLQFTRLPDGEPGAQASMASSLSEDETLAAQLATFEAVAATDVEPRDVSTPFESAFVSQLGSPEVPAFLRMKPMLSFKVDNLLLRLTTTI